MYEKCAHWLLDLKTILLNVLVTSLPPLDDHHISIYVAYVWVWVDVPEVEEVTQRG